MAVVVAALAVTLAQPTKAVAAPKTDIICSVQPMTPTYNPTVNPKVIGAGTATCLQSVSYLQMRTRIFRDNDMVSFVYSAAANVTGPLNATATAICISNIVYYTRVDGEYRDTLNSATIQIPWRDSQVATFNCCQS